MSGSTSNKSLNTPANNSNINVWDVPVNANWTTIDNAMGGVTNLSVTGVSSSRVILTATQYAPLVLNVTGTLTANVTYAFPTTIGGQWIVYNNTTGAYTLSFASGAFNVNTITVPQGSTVIIASFLSNVYQITPPATTAIGSVVAYAGASAPTYYQLCYGQAISRSIYFALFAVIGTTFGTGDGSTTFNVPDLRGRMLAGVDNMGGSAANRVTSAVSGITGTTLGATGGDQHAQQDTLTVVDPGHLHTANQLFQGIGSTAGPNNSAVNFFSTSTGSTNTATTGITVTSGLTGASQNMPPTAMINYIIYAGA
jgi:microcystin-dependent protein